VANARHVPVFFSGLAEQFHVLNEQLSCTQTFNYRNGGIYRDFERHSDICTVDTYQTAVQNCVCVYHRQPVLISF
jgi:hypothetical protein